MKRGFLKHSEQETQKKANVWHDSDEVLWTIREWAVRIGVKAPQLRWKAMNDIWGNIASPGWMILHPDLLSLPKDLGEFVIVHELVHLLVPNHGKLFKCFMLAYMPDWEERERRLQKFAQRKSE